MGIVRKCLRSPWLRRSTMDTFNQTVDVKQIDSLITTMLREHNLQNRTSLSFEDFQVIMEEYKNELENATLETPGEWRSSDHGLFDTRGSNFAGFNECLNNQEPGFRLRLDF